MSLGNLADQTIDDLLQDIDGACFGMMSAIRAAWARRTTWVSRAASHHQQPPRPPQLVQFHPIHAHLCKLAASLDPLENPPCSQRESGEWIAFENRHSSLVRNATESWILALRTHGLFDQNRAHVDRVQRALRTRSTTTAERDLARVLRQSMLSTRL